MLQRLGSFFLDIIEVVVLAVAMFLFCYLLIFQPHKIDGHSMDPTFHDKEYLLTDRFHFKVLKEDPKRGDVVVFKAPTEPDKEYIKRVIGLPGETIALKNGKFYINNKLLNEPYLPNDLLTIGGYFLSDGSQVTVPAGNFFVCGDNRNNSSDSRYWGFLPKANLNGRAWLRYWPLTRAGIIPQVNY